MCKIDRDTLDKGRAPMTLAVCAERTEERNRLSEWIMHYCKLCGVPASVICIDTPEQLSRQPAGAIQIAFIGFGDYTGFLAARALRERDHACSIVLIDDTSQYAIQGMHLHLSDFILRPVEFRHITRSMRLILGRF